MNKRDADKWEALVANCETLLADESKQSMHVFRGEMRAIVAMAREREQGARRPRAAAAPLAGPGEQQ